MKASIVLLPGDGIGSEVVAAGREVLTAVANRFGHRFALDERDVGGVAIDKHGEPLPHDTFEACQGADAILLGAVGGPKWDRIERDKRPERGLLKLRASLDLFCNLRPAAVHRALADASTLRPEIVAGLDSLIVPELTADI